MSDLLRENIARILKERGLSMRRLSDMADLNESAVRDILSGRSQNPLFGTVERIARALGYGVADLVGGKEEAERLRQREWQATQVAREKALLSIQGVEGVQFEPLPSGLGARDFPVYAAAEGGPRGAMIVESQPMGYVLRPEPLLGVTRAYGVYCVGSSMEPMYFQGDTLLVHPGLPAERNRPHIFVRASENGDTYILVKFLVRWNDRAWRVRQYNPAEEFDLPRDEWKQCFRVVGKYERR